MEWPGQEGSVSHFPFCEFLEQNIFIKRYTQTTASIAHFKYDAMGKRITGHFVLCNFHLCNFNRCHFNLLRPYFQHTAISNKTNVDNLILIRYLIILFRFYFHLFLKPNLLVFTQFLIFFSNFDVFKINDP